MSYNTIATRSFRAFCGNDDELFANIDVSTELLDNLQEAGILNSETRATIEACEGGGKKRATKLIFELREKGDDQLFNKFCDILRAANQDTAVNLIDLNYLKSGLADLIETEFGLLEPLRRSKLLTPRQVAEITAEKDIFKQRDKLLEFLGVKIFDGHFLTELERNGQSHVANFIRHRGVKPPDIGDDWPLDEDRLSILENNSEELANLISPHSGLISFMFAKECITPRQKEHIEVEKRPIARYEMLLNLMQRKSIRDFKLFVECLEKSSHGENVLRLLSVAAPIHVDSTLEPPNSGDVGHLELNIESQFKDLLVEPREDQATQEQFIDKVAEIKLLAHKLGLEVEAVILKKQNSVGSYFICDSLGQLTHIRSLYVSGQLKPILEDIFTLLSGSGEKVRIRHLYWSDDNYRRCLKRLQPIKAPIHVDSTIESPSSGDIVHLELETESQFKELLVERPEDQATQKQFDIGKVAEIKLLPNPNKLGLEVEALTASEGDASLFAKVPLELLESMLVKATVSMFIAISHEVSIADETTLIAMSSVSRCWWLSIVNRRYNTRRLRKLFDKLCLPYRRRTFEVNRFQTPKPVYGITQLDDYLFVVCYESSSIDVYQYTDDKYSPLTSVDVDVSLQPVDIVACSVTRQLYIADTASSCIWKLPVQSVIEGVEGCKLTPIKMTISSGDTTGTADTISSLSVTKGRLLALSPSKLCVFTRPQVDPFADKSATETAAAAAAAGPGPDKWIELPDYMNAWHAVETNRGTYVVSHIGWGDSAHDQVSELDSSGRVLRAYGGERGPGAGQLDLPWYLVVDAEDPELGDHEYKARLMVADLNNKRVVLLDAATLTPKRVLVQTGDEDGSEPWRMCYDRRRGILAVGMTTGVALYSVADPGKTVTISSTVAR